MLLIVAHHYVVSSGLTSLDGPLMLDNESKKSIFLTIFGAWGKTGINCFLMITGYYMCVSRITVKKYIKLLLEVLFYNVLIYSVFLVTGYEDFSLRCIAKSVLPIWGFERLFTSCFLAFYLFIPFLSLLVQTMTKKQHLILIVLLLSCYTILPMLPGFKMAFNYITWFSIIFIIASFIRLHPVPIFDKQQMWGWVTLGLIVFAVFCILIMNRLFGFGSCYYLVSDSNMFFAVAIAISSFLWFKNLRVRQSRIINALGASTFGVLLIHANSSAMRTWLWKDTVNVVEHYSLPLDQLAVFSVGVVLLVYFSCTLIDQVRIWLLEKPFFKWYDKHLDNKLNFYKDRVLCQTNKLL